MTELVVFEYEGEEVRFDPAAQMWNLNVMHRAAGSERSKEPSRWLNQAQTQDLLAALTEAETTCLNGSISVLVETREGRNGGTWALPVLALAYAHYLLPKFYIACNRWMLERVTGQQISGAPSGRAKVEARLNALEAEVAQLKAERAQRKAERAQQPALDSPARFTERRQTGRRDAAGNLIIRRITERIVEEVQITNCPTRPLNAAIRTVLRQVGKPLRPIEVTALLQAAGLAVAPVQVSTVLWEMARVGKAIRDNYGMYALSKRRKNSEGALCPQRAPWTYERTDPCPAEILP